MLRGLNKLGCDPSAAVYIGDNPAADIRAAATVGMKTLWKSNEYFPEPGVLKGYRANTPG